MLPNPVYHALVLNLHQPWGNLDQLLNTPGKQWKAKEILFAYDRIPRAVEGYEDIARVHLALSGSLLEALSNPEFQARVYGIVQCGDLLWRLRHPSLAIMGTSYYHPVLPLIPAADREEHIARWRGIGDHLFGRAAQGFWPPEMGFTMELIPLLKKYGYRYVIVDSENLVPKSPMRWEELRYRPHVARFNGAEIVVIPRDRDLSIAQEGGMESGWFIHELTERTKWCAFPPIVCTATDGDNGGWFRNVEWASNYWGAFYRPFCQHARCDQAVVKPAFIDDYLDRHGAHGEVIVRTGAWNTGEHDGVGFVQWTGSRMQQDARKRVAEVSKRIHGARRDAAQRGWPDPAEGDRLEEAMWRLLRAETSCNFFWGEAWVSRCQSDLDEALRNLDPRPRP